MSDLSRLHQRIQSKGVLLGCSIESATAAASELAAVIGYDIIWIDMEHHAIGLREAEVMSQAAKAGGALSILRVPSADRPFLLGGLETGADMIMVPMVEHVATAKQMVEYGKYRPVGNRGFVGSSRGFGFGLGGTPVENMERVNRETHLFVQIETMTGLENCADILAVEGISGGVVGPADLSVSMGKPMAFEDREFQTVFATAIRRITEQKKIAMTATVNPALIKIAIDAGARIIVTASERGSLKAHWAQNIKDATALIQGARSAA